LEQVPAREQQTTIEATVRSILAAMTLTALLVVPANAEITITRAEHVRGVLVVHGETSQPNQRVTLDDRYSTRTDKLKEFRFRVRYLPADCVVSIRAGQEARPAFIANCNARIMN
jgi:hypothetical protein